MFAKKTLALCLALVTADLSYNVLHVRAATAPDAAIYTAAQAKRGDTLYHAKCAMCHGAQADGMGPMPPLNTDDFIAKYSNQPVLTLFDKIQKTMPADHPGSLTRPETADVTTYILSLNNFPAGEVGFPGDESSLKKLQLQKPPKP